eukprot:scaffold45719_cov26-Tisochrysis_lutea.AAC.2
MARRPLESRVHPLSVGHTCDMSPQCARRTVWQKPAAACSSSPAAHRPLPGSSVLSSARPAWMTHAAAHTRIATRLGAGITAAARSGAMGEKPQNSSRTTSRRLGAAVQGTVAAWETAVATSAIDVALARRQCTSVAVAATSASAASWTPDPGRPTTATRSSGGPTTSVRGGGGEAGKADASAMSRASPRARAAAACAWTGRGQGCDSSLIFATACLTRASSALATASAVAASAIEAMPSAR